MGKIWIQDCGVWLREMKLLVYDALDHSVIGAAPLSH